MLNPWINLPNYSPFVLPDEAELVARHNQHPRCNQKPTGRINLALRPVPFIGAPNAPIVLLTLNPGDKKGDEIGQSNDVYRQLSRANLKHKGGYYYLHPELPACPGKNYAQWQFKALLERINLKALYKKIFLAQYMPYHSNEYVNTNIFFPSQRYTFALVSAAVSRGALIVILRSKRLWLSAVPALGSYPNVLECSNPRAPTISPGSLGPNFERIVSAISEAQQCVHGLLPQGSGEADH